MRRYEGVVAGERPLWLSSIADVSQVDGGRTAGEGVADEWAWQPSPPAPTAGPEQILRSSPRRGR